MEVADFKYEHETRLAAAKALNDKTGSYRAWATEAKGDLNKALKDDVDAALNIVNLKEFRDSQLTRPLREWYLRQQDLLGSLPPLPPGGPGRGWRPGACRRADPDGAGQGGGWPRLAELRSLGEGRGEVARPTRRARKARHGLMGDLSARLCYPLRK